MPIPPPKPAEKDTFHNLIFVVDNMVTFGTVNSTVLTKLSLSEGGGGWRKTLKISQSKFRVLFENLNLYLYLTS